LFAAPIVLRNILPKKRLLTGGTRAASGHTFNLNQVVVKLFNNHIYQPTIEQLTMPMNHPFPIVS
jgi:hypothetical protein